jgi:hypothetical protein
MYSETSEPDIAGNIKKPNERGKRRSRENVIVRSQEKNYHVEQGGGNKWLKKNRHNRDLVYPSAFLVQQL